MVDAKFVSPSARYAAGGLYSTVDDLLKWDQALRGDSLLNATSRAEMFHDDGHGYGLGWYVDRQFGRAHAWHNGIMNGFLSRLDSYPDERLTVIVLANDMNSRVWPITIDLSAIFLDVPPREVSPTSRTLLTELIDGWQRERA